MKRFFFTCLAAGLLVVFSCSDSTKTNKDLATVKGTVYGLQTDNQIFPVSGSLITVENFYAQTHSGTDGHYEFSIELDSDVDQATVKINASKAGYETSSASLVAKKGEVVEVPDITLKKILNDTTGSDTTGTDTTHVSGEAAHIEVYGSHVQHIYVLGSGLAETARIYFLVTDAQGVPVDYDHRVQVRFSILNGPHGGEYVFPDTMTTHGGQVYTVLSSGIVAGPVQIQASITQSGATIQAVPIRMAIFGGLPDPAHFSLASDILNIAGLKFSGLLDHITAFVGDRYSNPVAPGTVVYFSSDYGIVDGSAVTDDLGRATVQFLTASPRPPSPADSAFVHITGWTFRDSLQENLISSRTRVLLTDNTAPIQVSPTTFSYNLTNTPVNFAYAVSDIWGLPIIGDSRIRVTSTDGDVYGDTDVTIQDTQQSGPGSTQFAFTWAPGDSLDAPEVYINIKVTTPNDGNGYRSLSIAGFKQ